METGGVGEERNCCEGISERHSARMACIRRRTTAANAARTHVLSLSPRAILACPALNYDYVIAPGLEAPSIHVNFRANPIPLDFISPWSIRMQHSLIPLDFHLNNMGTKEGCDPQLQCLHLKSLSYHNMYLLSIRHKSTSLFLTPP